VFVGIERLSVTAVIKDMLKILKEKGFASVLEVIVTAVIFMVAAFGIMTTVSMLRPHNLEVSREIAASYHAKNMMDYLRGQVDAVAWEANTGPLAKGGHSNAIGDYTINWSLTEVNPADYPAGLAPRKMSMNVYYPD
jgi:hypothetical protein